MKIFKNTESNQLWKREAQQLPSATDSLLHAHVCSPSRGHHTFERDISIYQIWSFHRVSYLRDFDHFKFNLGQLWAGCRNNPYISTNVDWLLSVLNTSRDSYNYLASHTLRKWRRLPYCTIGVRNSGKIQMKIQIWPLNQSLCQRYTIKLEKNDRNSIRKVTEF